MTVVTFALVIASPLLADEDPVDVFKDLVQRSTQLGAAIEAEIRWVGKLTPQERHSVIEYVSRSDSDIVVFKGSTIVKHDLNGDAKDEYIVTGLVRSPSPARYGELVCVLNHSTSNYKMLCARDPDRQTHPKRELTFRDITGDGVEEIIDQEAWGEDDASPGHYAAVYRINGQVLDRLYSGDNYEPLEVRQLDGQRTKQVLQYTRVVDFGYDAGSKGWWVNVLAWDGKILGKSDCKFREFYAEKQKDYEEIKKKAIADNDRFRAKTGTDNELNEAIVKAMNDYLERIRKFGECTHK